MSENSGGGATIDRALGVLPAGAKRVVQLGIVAAARPVGRCTGDDRAEETLDTAGDGRREDRSVVLVTLQPFHGLGAKLGREVDQIVRHVEEVPRVAE